MADTRWSRGASPDAESKRSPHNASSPPAPPAQIPDAIDTSSADWPTLAAQQLKQHRYARLRLPPEEVRAFQGMFTAVGGLFDHGESRRQLRIPDATYDNLDSRSGFVSSRMREWLELHASTPAQFDGPVDALPATCAMASADNIAKICRARCRKVLEAIVEASPARSPLRALFADELLTLPPAGALETSAGFTESMLRVYRYHRDADEDARPGDGHYDMGLLTIIPKSTSPGLQIRTATNNATGWRAKTVIVDIEQTLQQDEAIMFGGMTLGRLIGQPALFHNVCVRGRERYSSCYFFRPSPKVILPAHSHHEAESIAHFNARARAAYNDELTSEGTIQVQFRHRRDYERRLARELRCAGLASDSSAWSDKWLAPRSPRSNSEGDRHKKPQWESDRRGKKWNHNSEGDSHSKNTWKNHSEGDRSNNNSWNQRGSGRDGGCNSSNTWDVPMVSRSWSNKRPKRAEQRGCDGGAA